MKSVPDLLLDPLPDWQRAVAKSFKSLRAPFCSSRNTITGCLLALRLTLETSYVTLMAPVGRRFTLAPEAIQAAFVLLFVPPSSSELLGFGGVTGMCTRSILLTPFSTPWQPAFVQPASVELDGCALPLKPVEVVRPALASLSVTPRPLSKSIPSWQAPHASRLGAIFQLSPCGVTAAWAGVAAEWQFWQLRESCG